MLYLPHMPQSPAEQLQAFLDKHKLQLSISPLVFGLDAEGRISLAEQPHIIVSTTEGDSNGANA